MKQIAAFGCSFTQGIPPYYHSWTREFADVYKEYSIDDYSKGGSSVKWSVSQLLKYNNKNIDSFKIFQVTTPYRITIETESLDCCRETRTENHTMYNTELAIILITMGINFNNTRIYRHISKKLASAIHKILYTYMDISLEELEWAMYIKYAMKNSDFLFFHREDDRQRFLDFFPEYTNLNSVENMLGKKYFRKHVFDNGDHLDKEAVQKVATWIKTQISI
jgi:hypothetical protein